MTARFPMRNDAALPLVVERYSQDRARLEQLYQNGFADAAAGAEKLRDFLSA